MKLLVATMLSSMLCACTGESGSQSETASAELAALGVEEVHRTPGGYQLLAEDGSELGEILFKPGSTTTTFRGDHHELRVGADGVAAVCNGVEASLSAEGATGLEALDACGDAARATGLVVDPENVPVVEQTANLADCRLLFETGCTGGEVRDGYWVCTESVACLCYTCSGNCICSYGSH